MARVLTARVCAWRLRCSFMMEYDIHTLLDFLTLFATLWVIYTLRFPLKASYQAEQDSVYSYYVVCARPPAALKSLVPNPLLTPLSAEKFCPFPLKAKLAGRAGLRVLLLCGVYTPPSSPEVLDAPKTLAHMLRFPLKASHQAEQGSVYSYYMVCAPSN